MGGLELKAAVMGERPNTKTSSHAQIHTYVQFRTTNYLTCMYLNCGKKPVYPPNIPLRQRENMQTPYSAMTTA